MSCNNKSCLFFNEGELSQLIQDVIHHKEFSESNFIQALPLYLQKLNESEIKKDLIPFIKNWINFADRTNACSFISMLPLFMPPHYPFDLLDDLLFPINDIIRQSSIFIESQMMEVSSIIAKYYDINRIETLILPSLDQLFIPSTIHPQGLAIRIQSYFFGLVNDSWKEKIIDRVKCLAKSKSTYVKICVLKSIPYITSKTKEDSPLFEELINDLLIPCLSDKDFKVKTAALASATLIGTNYFSNSQWAYKYLQMVEDPSWYVRFALAQQIKKAIIKAPDPSIFALAIIKLVKDSVTQVQSISLNVFSECIKYFTAESLSEVPQIFEQGMNSPFEDIRSGVIDLWASLLRYHPHANFHNSMINTLNLIGVLPIESVTYHIMHKVVPLVDSKHLNKESLKKGFLFLFNAATPNWRSASIQILRLYTKYPILREFANEMTEYVFPFINAPSFMVRCVIGEMFLDFIKEFSWNWFLDKPIDFMRSEVNFGCSEVKISLSRTIVELLSINPPDEIKNELLSWLNNLENDEIITVKENAIYCHSILDRVLAHKAKKVDDNNDIKMKNEDDKKKSKKKKNTDDDYEYYEEEEEEEEEAESRDK
ncbi:hypothetical protein M9Y10_043754 [Tritrichomonas musculus]|uniref:HEAT repeat family protein n=1 Tax=Tritrichomonas musculus TaxID=1915356 RepID=A0ABR2K104_9EUKA